MVTQTCLRFILIDAAATASGDTVMSLDAVEVVELKTTTLIFVVVFCTES